MSKKSPYEALRPSKAQSTYDEQAEKEREEEERRRQQEEERQRREEERQRRKQEGQERRIEERSQPKQTTPKKTGLASLWDTLGIGGGKKETASTTSSGRQFGGFTEDVRQYSGGQQTAATKPAAKKPEEKKPDQPEKPKENTAYDDFNAWDEDDEDGADEAQPRAATEEAPKFDQEHYNALRNELAEIDQNAGYITDPEAANASAARKKEIIDELTAMDEQAGNAPRYYDDASRLGGTLESWGDRTAAAYSNTLGTVVNTLGEIGERYGNASPYAGYAQDEASAAAIGTGTEEEKAAFADDMQQAQAAGESLQAYSDAKRQESQEELAKVKEGLDAVDSTIVDVVMGALDLGADAVANVILPGSGTVSMGTRVFGDAAADTRAKGGSTGKQILSGLKSMAIEILTEKIGGPFEKVYGKTFLGDATNAAVEKIGKTALGKRVVSMASDFLSEGFEEVASNVLNAVTDRLLRLDPDAKVNWSEALYEGLVGGLLGLVGGGFRGTTQAQQAQAIDQIADAAVQSQLNQSGEASADAGTGTAQGVDRAMEMLGIGQESAQPAQSLAGENRTVPDSGTGSADPIEQQAADSVTRTAERMGTQLTPEEVRQAVDWMLGIGNEISGRAASVIDAITNPALAAQNAVSEPSVEPQGEGDIPAPPTAAETTTEAPDALNSNEGVDALTGAAGEPSVPAPQPVKQARGAANELIGDTGTRANRQRVQDGLQGIADYIQSNNNGQGIDEDTLNNMAQQVAADILNEIPGEQTGDPDLYNNLRSFLAGRGLQISDELRGDVTDYNDWRRSLFGKLNLTKNGEAIDSLYQELSEVFGEGVFPPGITSQSEMVQRIADVLESSRPQSTYWVESLTESDYYEALDELTRNVLEQAQNVGSNANALSYENLQSLDENAPPDMVERGMAEAPAAPAAEPRRLIDRTLPQQTNNTPEMAQQMSQGEAAPGADVYDVLGQANGTIAPGEKAAREANMPRGVNDNERVSEAARTVYEAQATPDSRLNSLRDAVVDGQFAYVPTTNNSVTQNAERNLERNGWDDTYMKWKQDIAAGKANEDMVATGAVLLNNAGNSTMSGRAYVDLVSDYSELLHRLGRGLAAGRILKTLSPEGRLYGIHRSVQKMNEAIREAQSGTRTERANESQQAVADEDIQIPEELNDRYLKQTTDEGRDAVVAEMQKAIAQQIRPTFREKLAAFRYTAMLGNFKTQVRNLGGNTLSTLMRMAKDRTAALMESAAYAVNGGKTERTKAIWAGSDLYLAANADYENVADVAQGEAKYGENKRFEKGIEDNRTIFKSKVLERWRKATKWAMEEGDNIFIRFNYADALAGWLRAHNITAEQWSRMVNDPFEQETVDRARKYAIQQAQEATFHDKNEVSDWMVRVGRGNTDSKFGKAMQAVGEGILPFRRTPANVMVRSFEYSPLGILETGYKVLQRETGKADVSSAEIFDSLSKNLTGTGLAALGFLLAAGGHARARDDDDKQENFDKQRGMQDYSVTWNGKSFTMDWASPASVAFFMGVRMQELAADGGLNPSEWSQVLNSMTGPMLEMSMLSGVNDTLESLGSYGNDAAAVPLLIENSVASLLGQYAPTLLGQFEQLAEDYRQTTYTTNDSVLPRPVQKTISKAMAKIPGLDYQQQDYIDAWGRKQANQTGIGRALEVLASPGYVSQDRSTPVDSELQRLYDSGVDGAGSVLPSYADRNPGGGLGRLTPEEYETYATVKGQTSLALVQDFIESKEYRKLKDEQRVETIKNLYKLANDSAKTAVLRQRDGKSAASDPVTALLDAGMSQGKAGSFLMTVSGGDGKVSQSDLKDYYASHPKDETYIAALWDAAGYTGKTTSTWAAYKASNKGK